MIFSILKFIFICLEVLAIFNLLIIVHELGHFLAAKWRGLVIERFGIWFGKPIIEKKIGGIPFSLGCIPAGGFVALPQMAPMDIIEGKTDVPRETLPPASVLDKIIVAFAGPLFSFGLAFVFAVVVWAIGKPTAESEATTTIGYVEQGSPAQAAGLQAGDKILEVDGHSVKRFLGQVDSVTWHIIRSEGDKIPFKVERAGQILTIESGWEKADTGRFRRAALRQVRILPKMTAQVDTVEPGGPADTAGLKVGDIITEANGEKLFSPIALSYLIKDNPDQPVRLGVQRGSENLQFEMKPAMLPDGEGGQRPRIGIVWAPGNLQLVYPSPFAQVRDSVQAMVNMIGALLSPKSGVKASHMSGPVGIMNLYYKMFQSEEGWRMAIWFSVLFNVNLALLNLLPIPVLDGGHILLAIVEGIRRRPANPKVVEAVTGACAVAIISFMVYVTFFDVQDIRWPWNRSEKALPAPSPTPGK